MKRSYQVLISIIAIVFSILSASMGISFVSDSNVSVPVRFLYAYVFIMTPVSTIWLVTALIRKGR